MATHAERGSRQTQKWTFRMNLWCRTNRSLFQLPTAATLSVFLTAPTAARAEAVVVLLGKACAEKMKSVSSSGRARWIRSCSSRIRAKFTQSVPMNCLKRAVRGVESPWSISSTSNLKRPSLLFCLLKILHKANIVQWQPV